MKLEQYKYKKVKEDAVNLTEIATRLETISSLEAQKLVDGAAIQEEYEKRQLRDIKNLLANIYLNLELHKVEGMVDEIFNSEYQPKK